MPKPDGGELMSDAELIALALLTQFRGMQAQIANHTRERNDHAPAYGEDWEPPEVRLLEAELKKRGVLP